MKWNKLKDIVAIADVLIVSVAIPLLTFFIGKESFTAATVTACVAAVAVLSLLGVKVFKLNHQFNSLTFYRFLAEVIAFMFWLTVAFWGGNMIHAVITMVLTAVLIIALVMLVIFKDLK